MNELTSNTNTGTLTVVGTTTSAATSVTVNGTTAARYGDATFAAAGLPLTTAYTAIAADSYGRHATNAVSVNLAANTTFQYDGNGNLTGDGLRNFAYDDENQLIQVLVSNQWMSQFTYDGKMRRRIRQEYTYQSGWVQTNIVYYVYDGNEVIQERNANNLPTVTYTRGKDLSGSLDGVGGIGGLLARLDMSAGQSAFYHSDANGNITMLINSSNAVVAKYLYDAFGGVISKSGILADANLYRFSSKESETVSGLVYYLYRFYAPNLQRWLNRDPIDEDGSVDLYCYIGNDPVNLYDADGLIDCSNLASLEHKLKTLIDEMKNLGFRRPFTPGQARQYADYAKQVNRLLTQINRIKNGGCASVPTLCVVAAGTTGAFTGYYCRNEVNQGVQTIGAVCFDWWYGNPFGTSVPKGPEPY